MPIPSRLLPISPSPSDCPAESSPSNRKVPWAIDQISVEGTRALARIVAFDRDEPVRTASFIRLESGSEWALLIVITKHTYESLEGVPIQAISSGHVTFTNPRVKIFTAAAADRRFDVAFGFLPCGDCRKEDFIALSSDDVKNLDRVNAFGHIQQVGQSKVSQFFSFGSRVIATGPGIFAIPQAGSHGCSSGCVLKDGAVAPSDMRVVGMMQATSSHWDVGGMFASPVVPNADEQRRVLPSEVNAVSLVKIEGLFTTGLQVADEQRRAKEQLQRFEALAAEVARAEAEYADLASALGVMESKVRGHQRRQQVAKDLARTNDAAEAGVREDAQSLGELTGSARVRERQAELLREAFAFRERAAVARVDAEREGGLMELAKCELEEIRVLTDPARARLTHLRARFEEEKALLDARTCGGAPALGEGDAASSVGGRLGELLAELTVQVESLTRHVASSSLTLCLSSTAILGFVRGVQEVLALRGGVDEFKRAWLASKERQPDADEPAAFEKVALTVDELSTILGVLRGGGGAAV